MDDASLDDLAESTKTRVCSKLQSMARNWSQKCGKLPNITTSNERVYFSGKLHVHPLSEIPKGPVQFSSDAYRYASRKFNVQKMIGGDSGSGRSGACGRIVPDARQIFRALSQLVRTLRTCTVAITPELLETSHLHHHHSIAGTYCNADPSLNKVLLSFPTAYLSQDRVEITRSEKLASDARSGAQKFPNAIKAADNSDALIDAINDVITSARSEGATPEADAKYRAIADSRKHIKFKEWMEGTPVVVSDTVSIFAAPPPLFV